MSAGAAHGVAPHVGIVVASHSAKLAEGVAEMALQMARQHDPGIRIVPAGGDVDGELGEDATKIAAAIQSADSGAGVVVVVDLNGAVTAARFARENLLAPELAGRTRISRGPVAEAGVFAAVQASIGNGLEDVLAEADAAVAYDKHVDD